MNRNRNIHITIASVGLFISLLLTLTGIFILPPKETPDLHAFYTAVGFTGVGLFLIFSVYLAVAILNKDKEKSTMRVTGKIWFLLLFTLAALSLIVGGIITAIDFLQLGAGLIIGGVALLALIIDLIAESAERANKFISRVTIGTGTLIAIAIICVFLLI